MEIRDLSLILTMRKKCDVKNPYGGSLNLSYNFIYSFQKTSCFLSLVHVRNLHPGANFHPGCKFAPGVYFWPCERCFKNLHPVQICTGVQICSCLRGGAIFFAPGCKFAPGSNANLFAPGCKFAPGANCARERKLYNFNTF